MSYGGIEIANANRTRAYLNEIGLGIPASFANCDCGATDNGPYDSPVTDPAPWVDPNRIESEYFLGLLAYNVRIDSVATHSVTSRSSLGASIGRRYLRHRIVSVEGLMLARYPDAQSYGEAWLRDVLSGNRSGCSPDSLRVLMSCPEIGEAQFRTLRRCGIVDGPTFSEASAMPECYVQSVTFQIAAGVPWLMGDEIECLAEYNMAEMS